MGGPECAVAPSGWGPFGRSERHGGDFFFGSFPAFRAKNALERGGRHRGEISGVCHGLDHPAKRLEVVFVHRLLDGVARALQPFGE